MGGKAQANTDANNGYSPNGMGAVNDPKGRGNLTLWDMLQPEGQQFGLMGAMQNPFAMFGQDGFDPFGDLGVVVSKVSVSNHKNEVVMEFVSNGFFFKHQPE